MAVLLPRQSASHFAAHAQQTLGSWDACMAKAYCMFESLITAVNPFLVYIS